MENVNCDPCVDPTWKHDSIIGTMFKLGMLGLGLAWLLKGLCENEEGYEEATDTDIIVEDGPVKQSAVMETKGDDGSQDISRYGDLAREIEKLSRQIESLNMEIEKLKSASRNPNGGFDEELLKKLAKIVFEQKVIRERLEKVLNAAV